MHHLRHDHGGNAEVNQRLIPIINQHMGKFFAPRQHQKIARLDRISLVTDGQFAMAGNNEQRFIIGQMRMLGKGALARLDLECATTQQVVVVKVS